MKKILIIEDSYPVSEMYSKTLHHMFSDIEVSIEASIPKAKKAIQEQSFDLYILDGSVIAGHTVELLPLLPAEKIIVISAEDEYVNDVIKKGITAYTKVFGSNRMQEEKIVFEKKLYQEIL